MQLFNEEGEAVGRVLTLPLDEQKTYFLTKWFDSKLAIWEEKEYVRMCAQINSKMQTKEIIHLKRFFMGAAAEIGYEEECDGWIIPNFHCEYVRCEENDPIIFPVEKRNGFKPLMLLGKRRDNK